MKNNALSLLCLFAASCICSSAALAAAETFPTPQLFAPGVVSGPQNDGAPTFTPDGRTLFFERSYARRSIIFVSQRRGRHWSTPQVAPFSGPWSDQQPALSPDGRYMIFASAHKGASNAGPWRVDRTKTAWSAPYRLPSTVNISDLMFKPSIAANGDLYFMSAASRGADGPNWQLYRAAWLDGAYQTAQPLDFSAAGYLDVDPFVAPDQSYLIFSSRGRRAPDDGHEHLYVVLHQVSGWGAVHPLRYAGDEWGADDGEAQVSPDGKTLYFMSPRSPPVDRTESRPQMLADIAQNQIWDNGNNNVWTLSVRALFDSNHIAAAAI